MHAPYGMVAELTVVQQALTSGCMFQPAQAGARTPADVS
jgi:hypothetical protein